MPVFLKGKKSCLFIHIPKAGGSSVEAAARFLGWREYLSVRGVNASCLSMFKSSPQHFHAEVLSSFLDFDRFDLVFSICRDPFSRFKSEYYWQLAQGLTDLPPDEWAVMALDSVRRDSWVFDNHLRPQSDFIPVGPKVVLFKLEEDGVRKAREALRVLGGDRSFAIRDLFSLGSAHKKASVKSCAAESVLDAFSGRVYEFYKQDYERFGYG